MLKMKKQLLKFGIPLIGLLFIISFSQCATEEEDPNAESGSTITAYTFRGLENSYDLYDCDNPTPNTEELCDSLASTTGKNLAIRNTIYERIPGSGIIVDDDPRPCPEISTCMPLPELLKPIIVPLETYIYEVVIYGPEGIVVAQTEQGPYYEGNGLYLYNFYTQYPGFEGEVNVVVNEYDAYGQGEVETYQFPAYMFAQ